MDQFLRIGGVGPCAEAEVVEQVGGMRVHCCRYGGQVAHPLATRDPDQMPHQQRIEFVIRSSSENGDRAFASKSSIFELEFAHADQLLLSAFTKQDGVGLRAGDSITLVADEGCSTRNPSGKAQMAARLARIGQQIRPRSKVCGAVGPDQNMTTIAQYFRPLPADSRKI